MATEPYSQKDMPLDEVIYESNQREHDDKDLLRIALFGALAALEKGSKWMGMNIDQEMAFDRAIWSTARRDASKPASKTCIPLVLTLAAKIICVTDEIAIAADSKLEPDYRAIRNKTAYITHLPVRYCQQLMESDKLTPAQSVTKYLQVAHEIATSKLYGHMMTDSDKHAIEMRDPTFRALKQIISPYSGVRPLRIETPEDRPRSTKIPALSKPRFSHKYAQEQIDSERKKIELLRKEKESLETRIENEWLQAKRNNRMMAKHDQAPSRQLEAMPRTTFEKRSEATLRMEEASSNTNNTEDATRYRSNIAPSPQGYPLTYGKYSSPIDGKIATPYRHAIAVTESKSPLPELNSYRNNTMKIPKFTSTAEKPYNPYVLHLEGKKYRRVNDAAVLDAHVESIKLAEKNTVIPVDSRENSLLPRFITNGELYEQMMQRRVNKESNDFASPTGSPGALQVHTTFENRMKLATEFREFSDSLKPKPLMIKHPSPNTETFDKKQYRSSTKESENLSVRADGLFKRWETRQQGQKYDQDCKDFDLHGFSAAHNDKEMTAKAYTSDTSRDTEDLPQVIVESFAPSENRPTQPGPVIENSTSAKTDGDTKDLLQLLDERLASLTDEAAEDKSARNDLLQLIDEKLAYYKDKTTKANVIIDREALHAGTEDFDSDYNWVFTSGLESDDWILTSDTEEDEVVTEVDDGWCLVVKDSQ